MLVGSHEAKEIQSPVSVDPRRGKPLMERFAALVDALGRALLHETEKVACDATHLNLLRPFRDAARHCQDETHGEVCCIFGQNTWCVGHCYAALPGRLNINVVNTGTEVGNDPEVFSGT